MSALDKYIPVKLDDAIIKATSDDGVERLRLSVKVDGHEVYIRFPAWGDYDFYKEDLAKLMLIIAKTAGNVEIDPDKIENNQSITQWSYIMSQILGFAPTHKLISKIFYGYLRPTVSGDVDDPEKWLKQHLDVSHIIYIFVAIMHLEGWIKKKSMEVLQAMGLNLTQPLSKEDSAKNLTSTKANSTNAAHYEFY